MLARLIHLVYAHLKIFKCLFNRIAIPGQSKVVYDFFGISRKQSIRRSLNDNFHFHTHKFIF